MAVRDIFKVSWKTFVNPAAWIDYEGLKNQNKTIFNSLKSLFARPQPDQEETFEQAMARLELTEADVIKTSKNYQTYAVMFFVLGILLMGYAFFLLFNKSSIVDWILGIAGSAFLFSQAFRFDFWALQMKQRKLGLTFDEWKRHLLGEKGTSK